MPRKRFRHELIDAGGDVLIPYYSHRESVPSDVAKQVLASYNTRYGGENPAVTIRKYQPED